MTVTTEVNKVLDAADDQSAPVREETPFRRFASDFAESKVAVAGLITFVVILMIAVLAPWISPTNPYDLATVDILDSRLAPGEKMMNGTTAWLGTDGLGRDMVSAMFYGLRISLGVGVVSGVIALCVGVCVGLASAYFGGRVDGIACV